MSEPTAEVDQDTDVPGAQALLRGLDVLLAIGTAPQPPRFRDLEKSIGIPRASLHRLLAALVSRRMVRHDPRTRTYHVGMRVLELSRRSLDQNSIIRAAKPELARVARRLQRTICVMVLDNEDVFVLDFEDADPSYGRLVRFWPRSRAIESAAGRSMLAALPKERCEAFLQDLSPTIVEKPAMDRLRADLGVAKALGYAVMTREPVSGRAGAASAILDETGYPIGALACLFETDQIPAEDLHDAGRALVEAAHRASGHIGMGYATRSVLPRPDTPVGAAVEVLATGRDFVGENPVWNPRRRRLYWVDVLAPALRWWDPARREAGRVELPRLTAGIAFDEQDRLVAAGQHGLFLLDPETGVERRLVDPEADRPDNRCNTVGVDPKGRLWVGTMAINHEIGRGSLYAVDADLAVHRHIDKVGMAKNVAFDTAGQRLYFADTANNVVLAFDFDALSGTIANRRAFLAAADIPGNPNGITVDAEDHLWVACLGGWRVCRYDPSGRLVEEVVLPVPMPTNCAFGGEDMATLYVTSTWIRLPAGLSAEAPASGQLIAVRTGTRGQPPRRFREASP
ncbi:SMP-30/gluconolactonase/LRE family protein [Chelatococcus asaccharovorans]|uniref:SMP-30/gluconolactonase/LRE family protein n=1 Tax=Chelatococcus asaccharovorans TaxID=28210 RepID=UPI00224C7133|nr:SMP-30/gluconolactonase/LRE family protein [Chelatococcus asaccharovorans]CAH1658039.1 IclR family transcriptional regulator [Chelatococcus asaccharovorans]CAH1688877.1 IclR family transcriptional regulator [Chelatococcus asaccharovorans]